MKKIPFALIFIVFSFQIFIFGYANAQNGTEFLATWEANTYVPDWYQGVISPSYNSRINVKFELVENGRIANLSNTKIRWYVNDRLVRNESAGLGIKNYMVFNNLAYGGNDLEVRISIPEYKSGSLDKIIRIPVKNPEVALEAPYFNKQVEKGDNQFKAWPLFFNVLNSDALNFVWFVNGQPADKQSSNLNIFNLNIGNDVAIGEKMNLEARIGNIKNQIEQASKFVMLEVK